MKAQEKVNLRLSIPSKDLIDKILQAQVLIDLQADINKQNNTVEQATTNANRQTKRKMMMTDPPKKQQIEKKKTKTKRKPTRNGGRKIIPANIEEKTMQDGIIMKPIESCDYTLCCTIGKYPFTLLE